MKSEILTIIEIVGRERMKLDEPTACSDRCHATDAPFHDADCPANEMNRHYAYGLAVAKAVVEKAFKLWPCQVIGGSTMLGVCHDGSPCPCGNCTKIRSLTEARAAGGEAKP